VVTLQEYKKFKIISEDKRILLEIEEKKCPKCEGKRFKIDKQYHLYCTRCGLVLAAIDHYVGEVKVDLPWGLLY
jgi:ribosomal protein S27AE